MENEKRFYFPEDIAAISGVCLKTIYKELKAGNISHVKAGTRYLISRSNFEKWANGDSNRLKVEACT